MIRLAGIAPEQAAAMATSTPADAIGAADYGRIRPGAAGVLALMDENWEFAGVLT